MPALDEHGLRPEAVEALRRRPHLLHGVHREAREFARLEEVRRHQRRPGEQPGPERVPEVLRLQRGADGGDHHRVDDEGEVLGIETLRDGPDDLAGVEHPRLRRAHVEVLEDRVELAADSGGGQRVDAADAARVLCGGAGEDGAAVDADGGEGLQVGLDAGAAAGVAAGDREDAGDAGHREPPSEGLT